MKYQKICGELVSYLIKVIYLYEEAISLIFLYVFSIATSLGIFYMISDVWIVFFLHIWISYTLAFTVLASILEKGFFFGN